MAPKSQVPELQYPEVTLPYQFWLKCYTLRNLSCALFKVEGSGGLFKIKRETKNWKFNIILKICDQ